MVFFCVKKDYLLSTRYVMLFVIITETEFPYRVVYTSHVEVRE